MECSAFNYCQNININLPNAFAKTNDFFRTDCLVVFFGETIDFVLWTNRKSISSENTLQPMRARPINTQFIILFSLVCYSKYGVAFLPGCRLFTYTKIICDSRKTKTKGNLVRVLLVFFLFFSGFYGLILQEAKTVPDHFYISIECVKCS